MKVAKISNLDDTTRDLKEGERKKKKIPTAFSFFSRAEVKPKLTRRRRRHEQLRVSFGQ
jgi:hypothetical protein